MAVASVLILAPSNMVSWNESTLQDYCLDTFNVFCGYLKCKYIVLTIGLCY